MKRQAALHRIQVHLVQPSDSFLMAPNIEIMKAQLPKPWQQVIEMIESEPQLRGPGAPLASQPV